MVTIVDRTLLNFTAEDVSLYGNSRPLNFGWTSGNDWVLDTGRQTFELVDFDFGPFGEFRADAAVSFQFGLRLSAGLGGLGTLNTEYEIGLDVAYDDFVVAGSGKDQDLMDAGIEGTDVFFDFTKASVMSASSDSQGLGAAQVEVPGLDDDDQPDIPIGVSLDLVLGFSFELENIEYRLPFSSLKTVDSFEILDATNQTINLFKLDAGDAAQSFELTEDISVSLAVPTGADTEGKSTGSTIVSDKGFSNNPFLSIEGDLDALLLEYIRGIPFIGQVAATLEKTVFFSEELDLNDYIPFLPEEWFTLEATVVDLSAAAGLHVTEEVSVDIGYKGEEKLPDFQLGGGTSIIDQLAGLVGLDGEDPGESKTPNIDIVLRSDNGTPDDPLDDKIERGSVGEVITIAQPDAPLFMAGDVTVDAWFDVDSAKASHSVGLGGSFSVTLSVLSASIGGTVGEKLGISFGPVFELEIPEDGLQVDLFNFFTRRFDVEGGRFEDLPTGPLTEATQDFEDWGYQPGEFNQETAQYSYYFTRVTPPSGLDEADPESRKKTIAFAEANDLWVQEVRDLFDPLFEDNNIDTTVILNTLNDDLIDPNRSNFGPKIDNTAVLWTASGSGNAEVRLAFGYENVVIAAPTEDPDVDGLEAEYAVTILSGGGGESLSERLTTGLGKRDIVNFFNRLDASRNENQQGATGGFIFRKIIYGNEELNSELSPSVLGTSQNDLVIFFGEQAFKNGVERGFNAPDYLDGGRELRAFNELDRTFTGAQNDPVSIGDVFLANFNASFPDSAVFWDMRAEELAQFASNGATVTDTYAGVLANSAGGISSTASSITRSTGDYAGSLLEFREDGEVKHTTIVRDFETYLIRFGGEDDVVRTGSDGMELFEFKGGDDRLVILSDAFSDSYMMGEGNDFVVFDRTFFSLFVPDFENLSDFILGGRDFDEVLISTDENFSFVGQTGGLGLIWAFNQGGLGLSDYVDANSDAQSLLIAATTMNDILGSDTDSFGAIDDFDGGGPLAEQTYVQFAIMGPNSNGARIAGDVEVITVDGFDETSDLVFYTGGTAYTGGEVSKDALANGGNDAFDTFVADFGAFEAEKTVDGIAPGGVNLNGEAPGVVFADAYVGEFERFVVKGTSVSDFLFGGQDGDYLDGGAGDDALSAGGSLLGAPDTLVGGLGDDTFYYTQAGPLIVLGDTDPGFPTNNVPPLTGVQDSDLLILARDVSGIEEFSGLVFVYTNDDDDEIELTTDSSFDVALAASAWRQEAGVFIAAFGEGDDNSVIAFGIEHSNQQGSDAWNDVLLYDGGSTYLGGEKVGDADFFIADFSDQVEGVELLIDDNPENGGFKLLENGVLIGGLDRIAVEFGTGIDTVKGGRLNDYIDGGEGDDVLTGAGGDDDIRGGLGNDFVYYQGDGGFDTIDGGEGLDRLMISNMADNGTSFSDGGLIVDAIDATDNFFTSSAITASTEQQVISELVNNIDQAATFFYSIDGRFNEVRFSNFEAVDVQGSDAFDDAVLFQGGLVYAGGERGGDADLFFGNLSDETNDLTFRDLDARPGAEAKEAFYSIGNELDTKIGQFERYHVVTGSGDDSVEGGVLNDFFNTGLGDDIITGSLGDDLALGGQGDDQFSYIGGNDEFNGGGNTDRLEVAAQQSGYDLRVIDFKILEGSETIDASNPGGASAYRAAFDRILNTGNQDEVVLSHEFGSLTYLEMEYVFTTGSGAGDVFLSGSEGGVISSDGGNDILLSNDGDDYLIGGEGRDAYVFGEQIGHDIIANEFSGINEVHFIGLNLAQMSFSTDATGNNLIIGLNPANSVTITGYFAQSDNPQNFLFFADDELGGTTFDASSLNTAQIGGQETGNQFFGTTSSDEFGQGTEKAEFFFGFAGDDVFGGSGGADLLDGSLGNDLVVYDQSFEAVSIDLRNLEPALGGLATGDIFASIESVIGSTFGDVLRGSEAENNLIGGLGDDTIIGFEGDDLLSGGEGDDLIDAGLGNDMVFAGEGNDTIRADFDSDSGDDILFGEEGNDLIIDLVGNNRVTGGFGDDTVTTGSGDDIYLFEGQADPDRNIGEANGGRDEWDAGGGDDTVDFRNFEAGIFLFTSNEADQSGVAETSDLPEYDLLGNNRVLLTFSGVENTIGTEFDDILWGSSLANVIDARSGNDELLGRAGADTLIGGAGFDTINYLLEAGSNGVNVNLATGVAFDTFGDQDSLSLIEAVLGSQLDDTITGSDEDNLFVGHNGSDTIDGGAGIDTLDYSQEQGGSAVILDLRFNQVSDTFSNFEEIRNIERFILTDQGDIFVAGSDAVFVDIGGGDDDITGSGMADTVQGGLGVNSTELGGGDDLYIYGNGTDNFGGGSGFDILDLRQSDVRVNVDVPANIVFQFGTGRQMVNYTSVEQIIGSELNDGLFGFFDADILLGAGGDDIVQGRDNNDTLFGNSGDDTVEGGNGDDLLFGGTGNDIGRGGEGNDTYFYSDGVDIFEGDGDTDVLSFENFRSDAQEALLDTDLGELGVAVQIGATDAYDLGTMTELQTANGRDVATNAGTIRLVDFTDVEGLIGTEKDDFVDNVGNINRFQTVDLLAGDDFLLSQAAFGNYEGGDGFDTISYAKVLFSPGDLGLEIDLLSGRASALDVDEFAVDRFDGFEAAIGTNGDDSFIGDARNNYFNGLDGFDAFVGGAGSDTIDYSLETGTGPLLVNLFSSSVRDTHGNLEFASGIENIIGTNAADFFVGNDADNEFRALGGDDVIDTGKGNDTIYSGAGEDTVTAGDGDDLIVHESGLSDYDGGNGRDWIDFSLFDSAVRVNLVFTQEDVSSNGTSDWKNGGTFTEIATITSIEHAAGSLFSDLLIGSGSANILSGDAGDDQFTGFGSDDLFMGGAGFDVVDYAPEDGLMGIVASLATRQAQDSYGTFDTFDGIEGLLGSARADVLSGDNGDNLIVGNSGGDTLAGGLGIDTLNYGLEIGGGSVAIDLASGQATDSFGFRDQISGFEIFVGTDLADSFFGDGANSEFQGGAGNDTLSGGAGNDTLIGGTGSDTFVIASRGANVVITDFELGTDVLDLLDFDLTDAQQALAAIEDTDPNGDLLLQFGEGGSVLLEGLRAIDVEQLTVTLPALARPVLLAAAGGGTVTGSERPDFVQGLDGADTLEGGDGDDLLSGGLGDDMLDGGEGLDFVTYEDATGGGVTVNFVTQTSSGAGGDDSFKSIEGAIGTQSADMFVGSDAPEVFSGLAGNDMFRPGAGADEIETGSGEDQVVGDLEELDGDRILDFDLEDEILVEALQLDAAAVRVTRGSAIFEVDSDGDGVAESRFTLDGDFDGQTFEVLSDGIDTTIRLAGPGASQLSQAGERFITTDNGQNRIYGDTGDDAIVASGGDDILSGGEGADVLLAGDGEDILIGGLGADRMTGGADADIFAFDAVDFAAGLFTADFVTDFTPGEDKLELTGFGLTAFSELNFTPVGPSLGINLDQGRFIVLEGLSVGSLSETDISFGDAGRSYGLVATTVVHQLTEEDDRFLTTDDAVNEVRAGAGDDVVIGAGGEDELYGEAGADLLLGGDGADVLIGGAGGDRLTGGADGDRFFFEFGEETAPFIVDFITDFAPGEDWLLADGFGLSTDNLSFNTLPNGNLALALAPGQFVVFEGITDVAQFGPLTDVFDFG